MALTDVQKTSLIADIAVNRASIANGDTAGAADFYNAPASPDYMVWNPLTPLKDVTDSIVWANMTPNDAADGTLMWNNRSLACQGKQFNVQILLAPQGFQPVIDASKANIRQGLQDSLTDHPSGNNGALRQAGWTGVKTAMTRKATRIEKLLATGSGTTANPSVMGYVGRINPTDFNGIV